MRDRAFIERVLPECLGIAETVTFGASCGLIGSGKTSLANCVVEVCPSFKKDSLARPLKEEFAAENGINIEYLYDTSLKEQYRQGMQEHSEKYLSRDRYHYVRKLLLSAVPGQKIWCDDLRTIEECHVFWAIGGVIYQVYTDPYVKARRGVKYDPKALAHFTETEMAVVSGETMIALGGGRIYNNGTIDELRESAAELLKRHNLLFRQPLLV